MAIDSVLTPEDLAPDGPRVHFTLAPDATRILIDGHLCHDVVAEFDAVLDTLPHDGSVPILVRITSNEVEFGASDVLRQVLTSRRLRGRHQLAVWADEPLVRRGIPVALLHRAPPHVGGTWEQAVPDPGLSGAPD